MIPLRNEPLSPDSYRALTEYQGEIDAYSDYESRVGAAKDSFARRNRLSNPVFREIRSVLSRMCSGNRRCCYCEDSCADEVEHILPKDLFPEATFKWENYLYACGSCNGPKGNKFAVIDQHQNLVEITRGPKDPVLPPVQGIPALINPRTENPLDFIDLDIVDTFMFIPSENLDEIQESKAEFTIQVLLLNAREVLVQSRKIVFGSYKARLTEYIQKKTAR